MHQAWEQHPDSPGSCCCKELGRPHGTCLWPAAEGAGALGVKTLLAVLGEKGSFRAAILTQPWGWVSYAGAG